MSVGVNVMAVHVSAGMMEPGPSFRFSVIQPLCYNRNKHTAICYDATVLFQSFINGYKCAEATIDVQNASSRQTWAHSCLHTL